jgi:flavin-dependent dehydrogenase
MPTRFCFCFPRFPISGAQQPVTDHLAVVGDAHISRYFKNGIDSAFWTGTRAAQAVLAGDGSTQDLWRHYAAPSRRRFGWDNRCGRILFLLNDVISRLPPVLAAHIAAARREQAHLSRPRLTGVLWHMFTGDAPYSSILRDALRPTLQVELIAAALHAGLQRLSG